MNIKKILLSALAGASMLATLAGPGMAADVNVYGASAQYLFWNATAPGFLAAAPLNCTDVQQATFNSANAITKATCGGVPTYVRVSSKASFDGPSALMGDDHYATAGTTSEKCSAGDPGYPGATLAGYYRKMVDENSCTFTTPPAAPGACTALKCVRVTLGVSDVAAESFVQSSTGQLKGPLGGGSVTRSFSGVPVSGLAYYNPIVVPFAFFANNTVTRDINYPVGGGAHTANFQPITNLPRMMAVMIFSGQAWNWTDFGADFNSNPIVACLRHAGSGTHSTLDYAVMNNGIWGGNLVSAENVPTVTVPGATVYFNDGSNDEMKCINGATSGTITWSGAGAIGYADADQAVGAGSSYTNTSRLTYNGEEPSRVNIRNGRYDFWTSEWAYENPLAPEYSATHPTVSAMMTYAANPANIPGVSNFGADKTGYWASSGEMVYMKGTDKTYPAFQGAANPQLP